MPAGTGLTSAFPVRIAAFYAALFAIYGIHLPFLPSWLAAEGLGPSEIALVAAAPMIVRLFSTPALAHSADVLGLHGPLLRMLAAGVLAATLALVVADGLVWLLLVCLVLGVAASGLMPLVETVAMDGVRRAGLDYGRMRLWGSLAFIVANILGGLAIGAFGIAVVPWMLVAGAVATVAAAQAVAVLLPRAAAAPRPAGGHAGILALLARRDMQLFLLAMGTVQGAHAVLYAFGTIHWQSQGIQPVWIGALWAIGVVAEIVLFWHAGRASAALGAIGLMAVGAGASLVRWLAMTLDPPLALLVVLQALHALTYGAAHLGSMQWLARSVPEGQAATAQALYATISGGLAMGLSMLLAGRLYGDHAAGAFYAMAGLAGVGLAAVVVLWRLERRGGAAR
jgi:PPP family 3-phenylpropionic acid transporter